MNSSDSNTADSPVPAGIRIAALFAGYAFAAFLIFSGAQLYRAYRSSLVLDAAHLGRSMQLDRGNAAYWHKMGLWRLYGEQDAVRAIPFLQTATELNPYQARFWLDLATARSVSGDASGETDAIRKAAAAEPSTPVVLMEAATHLLVMNQTPEALQLFHRLLQLQPGQSYAIASLCWRALHDSDRIANEVLPAEPGPYSEFLRVLINAHATQDSDRLWDRLVALGKPIPAPAGLAYVDDLLARKDVEGARKVWNGFTRSDPALRGYGPAGNQIVNSRFDLPFLNDGFDWRFAATREAVDFSVDSSEVRRSSSSLQVTFNGDEVGDTGFYQLVPVDPAREYQLETTLKTAELASAAPLVFRLQDAQTGELLGSSNEISGSTGDWVTLTTRFHTASDTKLLKVSLAQSPRPSHLAGKLWIDSVELVPHLPPSEHDRH